MGALDPASGRGPVDCRRKRVRIIETSAIVVLLLAGASVRGAEPKSFKMAALKLIPVQWDKDANFAKLEEYARRATAALGPSPATSREAFAS
jgi:hypothetical protein